MNEVKAVDPNGNANANGKDVGETRYVHSVATVTIYEYAHFSEIATLNTRSQMFM